MRFDIAFCANPVCSPNRATLLTGLMPSQHGDHSWLGTKKPNAQIGKHAYNTIAEFPNLPDLLAGAGYHCGLTGKWHLGNNLHPPDAPPEGRLIFHEHECVRCVQDGTWKLILRHPDGPNELYHLAEDPGEWCNLNDAPAHRDQRDHLALGLANFFKAQADPQYDLWQSGRSKAGRTTAR